MPTATLHAYADSRDSFYRHPRAKGDVKLPRVAERRAKKEP